MFTLKSARAPRWSADRRSINLIVVFEESEGALGEIPFSASPDDTEEHGRDIYARAVEGEFGTVDDPTELEVTAMVMITRNAASGAATARITALQTSLAIVADAIDLGIATEEQSESQPALSAELDAWRSYRVYLARLEAQPKFPHELKWPEKPLQPFVYTKPQERTDA